MKTITYTAKTGRVAAVRAWEWYSESGEIIDTRRHPEVICALFDYMGTPFAHNGEEAEVYGELIGKLPEMLRALIEIVESATPIPDSESVYVPKLVLAEARKLIKGAT